MEDLEEAEFSNWSVEIPKQQGIDKKHTVTVKARNTREAAKKAAGRVGLGDRWMSIKLGKVTKLGMAEEVEEIDEISKKTLGSYINKASKSAAHSSGMAFRRFGRGTRKDDRAGDELEKKANKRLAGIATATKKLTKEGMSFKNLLDKIVVEEAEDIFEAPLYVSEDPQEEIPMMMRQLHFIGYAADEIMEYLATAEDPEEWYQNKLANAFAMMKTLHAYVEGDKRMGDVSDMMAGYYGEEVELDEANFKPSNLKLKSGESVKLSMQDAKTLNDLMKSLNSKNRKEMEDTLMKDKKGFEEILAFAKEAM
jgi:hypothetical protein